MKPPASRSRPKDLKSDTARARDPAYFDQLREASSPLSASLIAATNAPNEDYIGHRKRLRQRFMSGGASALADYELLEMVLFGAIPRGDVKPLAKRLIREFGGFAETISAPPPSLMAVNGVGETVVTSLKLVEAAAIHLTRERAFGRPVIGSTEAMINYVRAAMAGLKIEQFRLLFLNRKNVLITDEVQSQGTIDTTQIYPREVIRRALELGAGAIILVHNHPSGDPSPSKADVEMTLEIRNAAKPLGIQLHDHIIIGASGHTTMKTLGIL